AGRRGMARAAVVVPVIGATIAAFACSRGGRVSAESGAGSGATPADTTTLAASSADAGESDTGAKLAALASAPPLVPLEVAGFLDAVISVPLGARAPRPVLVATHGLWDFPEGLCDNWRWIVGDRAWVLCPRGTAMPDKTFRYLNGPALAKEIDAGVRALEERYPGYVDGKARIYTGFSLGAILGVWVIAHDPAKYPRAVLIE